MEPQIRYARSADGTSIAYSTFGEGRPLVYVGSPTQLLTLASDWHIPRARRAIELLGERRVVVRADARGRGLSDHEVSDRSMDAHVADTQCVVEAVARGSVDLFADSGGPIAIAYAARHPERVRKLILASTWARFGSRGVSPVLTKLFGLAPIDFEFYKQTMALRNHGWIEGRIAADQMRELSLEEFTAALEASFKLDASDDVARVQCPVLVVHNRAQEEETPVAASRRLVSSLPNAELRIVEAEGGVFDEDGIVASAIIEFLDRDDSQESAEKLPSGTAVILFADIVDSTALTERMGDAAFRDRARALDVSLRSIITAAGGAAIDGKLLGDGVLATFPAASQAIDAALRCAAAGDEQSLPLHLGLHAGDVIREQNNVFGGAVNIAARISALSAPGEVLVSDVVRALARTSASVTFEDRGEHALKGVADAQRVYAVSPSPVASEGAGG